MSFASSDQTNSDVIATEITYDEYIEKIAQNQGISKEEAVELDKQRSIEFIKNLEEKQDTKQIGVLSSNDELDYETYIKELAESKEISKEELLRLDEQQLYEVIIQNISYRNVTKTQKLHSNSNFSATLEAQLKLYSSGSFGQITDVMAITSRRQTGIGANTWEEMTAWYDGTLPSRNVTLQASGYFQVVTSSSFDFGVDAEFFSFGGSIGSESIYQSDTMYILFNYSL